MTMMDRLFSSTPKLAIILLLQAAGTGLASTSVIVMPSIYSYAETEWLPKDNQTLYNLRDGEVKRLELNKTEKNRTFVSITVSPCTRNLMWSVYKGTRNRSQDLALVQEYSGTDMSTFDVEISPSDRFVIELRSLNGNALCAVWARGESTRAVRLRLRRARRRRLSASWDPSPIDPQATTYCVVASWRRAYTSLCAARYDLRQENVVEAYDVDVFGRNKSYFRRKKFSRSTPSADEDPIIDCVGDRTHHTIDGLDSTKEYNVAIFGIGPGRVAGELQAVGVIGPKYTRAQTLKEGHVLTSEIKSDDSRLLFKYKVNFGSTSGMWLVLVTCGGTVDLEISVRGKVIHTSTNVGPYEKIHVQSPTLFSFQETSYEASESMSVDNSDEFDRIKYLVKVTPKSRNQEGSSIQIQLSASESRWGVPFPERVSGELREIRPSRKCDSLTIAFLPSTHKMTDDIRYCLKAVNVDEDPLSSEYCPEFKQLSDGDTRMFCMNLQIAEAKKNKALTQMVAGLESGTNYLIRIWAAKGNGAAFTPYLPMNLHTEEIC